MFAGDPGGAQPRCPTCPPRLDRPPLPPHPVHWAAAESVVMGLELGRWRVGRLLGEGSNGVVYRADDRSSGRPAALKFMVSEKLTAVRRFRREGRIARALQHPNIVEVLDDGEQWETPYLVLELMEGGSLGDLVRRAGPRPVRETLRMLRDAARGLAHAHRHGVVHRDLKPDNLLLDRGGNVKIADFGLAKHQEDEQPLTKAGAVVGSITWLAPELSRGKPADAQSDLYALGCVAYYLLTGKPPFGEGAVGPLVLAHNTTPFPDVRAERPDVPAGLAELLMRTGAKEPAERPTGSDEFARLVEGLLEAVVPSGRNSVPVPALSSTAMAKLPLPVPASKGGSVTSGSSGMVIAAPAPAAGGGKWFAAGLVLGLAAGVGGTVLWFHGRTAGWF